MLNKKGSRFQILSSIGSMAITIAIIFYIGKTVKKYFNQEDTFQNFAAINGFTYNKDEVLNKVIGQIEGFDFLLGDVVSSVRSASHLSNRSAGAKDKTYKTVMRLHNLNYPAGLFITKVQNKKLTDKLNKTPIQTGNTDFDSKVLLFANEPAEALAFIKGHENSIISFVERPGHGIYQERLEIRWDGFDKSRDELQSYLQELLSLANELR